MKWGFVAHMLRSIRKSAGLTRAELAELSGVAKQTIKRIEDDTSLYKINIETAGRIEDALNMTGKIFHPSELSLLGRPPATGVALGKDHSNCARYEAKCPHCYLLVPNLPHCGYCGGILDEARVFDRMVESLTA